MSAQLSAEEREALDIPASFARVRDSRETHVEWAAHLRSCPDCPHAANVHSAEEQDRLVAEYDNVLACLALAARSASRAMMDRPAYELVRLIEAALDDADQITDTPQDPNRIAVWGIRMLLEPYGGKPHSWQWPPCFGCDHQMPLHNHGPCDLCGCAITPQEIADGARDEALDEAIEDALRWDAEHRVIPPGPPTPPTPPAVQGARADEPTS